MAETDNGSANGASNPMAASAGASPAPTAGGPAAKTPPNRPAAAAAGASSGSSTNPAMAKAQAQMQKLRDANAKYKNLLKMAKERIQAQEEELERLRAETKKGREDLAMEKVRNAELKAENDAMMDNMGNSGGGGGGGMGGGGGAAGPGGAGSSDPGESDPNSQTVIVRVCQRIKMENDVGANGSAKRQSMDSGFGDEEENSPDYPTHAIWALVEYESYNPEMMDNNPNAPPPKRYQRWRKFDTDTELDDHVRRETGEPIVLPPYSLSPSQSVKIEEDAKKAVMDITEEFRRFRVRSEVARKQADATVRALHSSNVQTTRRRIEGQDLETELAQARTDHAQLAALRSEMAEQEARWKDAYDTLMAENTRLKSSGAEALLAAQWRQRYETCLREKEDIETRFAVEKEKAESLSEQRRRADAGKYEMKYRDLKESFRLYRKKAKEIFEAQQRGMEDGGIQAGLLSLSDHGTEEAKLAYLRNLMVNYLSSDPAVREHMEGAIGTVLKFSPGDFQKIEHAKSEQSWFG